MLDAALGAASDLAAVSLAGLGEFLWDPFRPGCGILHHIRSGADFWEVFASLITTCLGRASDGRGLTLTFDTGHL